MLYYKTSYPPLINRQESKQKIPEVPFQFNIKSCHEFYENLINYVLYKAYICS